MRRRTRVLAACLAAALAFAPAVASARLGDRGSMGSRGSRTYSAPPVTNTAPGTAAPMQRSMTPQGAPAPYYQGAPVPQRRPGLFGGSPFMSGLMGGLLGAGIGGLLFGGGAFGGMSGFAGFLGLLLQIFLLVVVVRFLFRLFTRRSQPALAGGPNIFARSPEPGMDGAAAGGSLRGGSPVQIGPADFTQFEQLLKAMQAAWSAQDLNALRGMASPEMISYFADQLAGHASRGLRNTVTDVKLEQGDLSEAWNENGRDYATVAMRFSMIDVTRDATGRVVEGDPNRRTEATELWTFMRAGGGQWILTAIQQVP